MAHMSPGHPKLHWKAFLRDLLLSLATFLGVLALGFILLMLSVSVHFEPPKPDIVRHDLPNILNALRRYHAKTGRFPTTEEGLRALVRVQDLEQIPLDPWGNPYGYELREGQPRVWSLGADDAPGGEGEDADISSHEGR
ncbi:type II secretion system protein GspG [Vitiosangium sp. GDMCC 1.1324]|uniref:type II secretion system protein GspG n=1 Tax=Vitiosangium sp. (strain GDMCC 1.1324) TaxID=2138576 RepID=UPI000D35D475|nr:type II secretion system protein GspG [Vitiosangium sp. GDMCC 1.1324]PTL79820.1 type II secretion system protein GspG [Vitiosangium sp. GDMCC 1.1324]